MAGRQLEHLERVRVNGIPNRFGLGREVIYTHKHPQLIYRPNATVGAPHNALRILTDPPPPAPAATYKGTK